MRKSMLAAALALLIPVVPLDAQSTLETARMLHMQKPTGGLLLQSSATIQCPMPVAVPELRNDMPVARPDSAVEGSMLVVRPGCHNPLGPAAKPERIVLPAAPLPQQKPGPIRDLFGGWLKRQPPADTSKRPPGG